MSRRHPGANNLARAGHRSWEISTAGTTYGLGYGTYAGCNVSTLHVLDNAAFDSSQLGAASHPTRPYRGRSTSATPTRLQDGVEFTVTVRGITNAAGDAKTLKYTTTFFKLS